MHSSLVVGIVLPSILRSGVQKIHTITALDLARNGHHVTIFVPLFPWYYYFVTLRKRPLLWLRYILPHVKNWVRDPKATYREFLSGDEIEKLVSIKFVARAASKAQLKDLDCLVLNSIEQVVGYRDRFPQERQIYLLHHPEEHAHGHPDLFRSLRKEFSGKTLVISPFTLREVSDHISPAVVPNPVSPILWEQRHSFDIRAKRQDILFVWKNNSSGTEGMKIVESLLQARPETTITVWCSGIGTRAGATEALPAVKIVENMSERELADLLLDHSLLLFPSTYEGFGMPPIEAMTCGCIPVLHPDVGAAELYAHNGENSIFLDGKPEEVAEHIAAVLDSPSKLSEMRSAAVESVTPFDPNGYGLRLLQAAGVPGML